MPDSISIATSSGPPRVIAWHLSEGRAIMLAGAANARPPNVCDPAGAGRDITCVCDILASVLGILSSAHSPHAAERNALT